MEGRDGRREREARERGVKRDGTNVALLIAE